MPWERDDEESRDVFQEHRGCQELRNQVVPLAQEGRWCESSGQHALHTQPLAEAEVGTLEVECVRLGAMQGSPSCS